IIGEAGKICEVVVLDDEPFITRLQEKLSEEVEEYRQSGTVEELADIVEVVQALVEHSGVTWEAFEEIRAQKRVERGGFRDRLFLIAVTEGWKNAVASPRRTR
ncbi:MAG TPA: nucleoside triphosphate pyrophosphohydrolase, partial [Chloroflexota bacterium]|nr:nucleoside triphosphate pyrophosphohydrolase [Chloroflexota bacterium]